MYMYYIATVTLDTMPYTHLKMQDKPPDEAKGKFSISIQYVAAFNIDGINLYGEGDQVVTRQLLVEVCCEDIGHYPNTHVCLSMLVLRCGMLSA